MAKIIFRITQVRLVNLIRTEDAGVNPSSARGGTVGLQSRITVNLRTVMRIAFATDTEHHSVTPAGVAASGYSGVRIRVPAVDLCQHRPHFWILRLVFGIQPI